MILVPEGGQTESGATSLSLTVNAAPTPQSNTTSPSPTGSTPAASSASNKPPPVPPRSANLQHVSTTYITADSEVTVTSGSGTVQQGKASAAPGSRVAKGGAVQISVGDDPKKNEILKLREMLLSDSSVQSS